MWDHRIVYITGTILGLIWIAAPVVALAIRIPIVRAVKMAVVLTLLVIGGQTVTTDANHLVGEWLYPGVKIIRNSPEDLHVHKVITHTFFLCAGAWFLLGYLWFGRNSNGEGEITK